MAALDFSKYFIKFEPQIYGGCNSSNEYHDYWDSENDAIILEFANNQNQNNENQMIEENNDLSYLLDNPIMLGCELENSQDTSMVLLQNTPEFPQNEWMGGLEEEPMQSEIFLQINDICLQEICLDSSAFLDFSPDVDDGDNEKINSTNQENNKNIPNHKVPQKDLNQECHCNHKLSLDKNNILDISLLTHSNMNFDQESHDGEDLKQVNSSKKNSPKQDGTLAFLRQCIIELKTGIDIMFTPEENILKKVLWNYLIKIAKKVEIQKQPKKKIKFLLIPCLDENNGFDNLNLEMSNLIRAKCYFLIRSKIESNQFKSNFLKCSSYGKIDKNGKEINPSIAEIKILNTLGQYFEELRKPSKFRGLYSDINYTPDINWIRLIEQSNRQNIYNSKI